MFLDVLKAVAGFARKRRNGGGEISRKGIGQIVFILLFVCFSLC
jgi:hypothetical protein